MTNSVRVFGVITALCLGSLLSLSCQSVHETDEASMLPTAAVPAKPALAAKPALVATSDKAVSTNSAPLTDVEPTLTIVYTNNIDGEIEPCG
jgi:hypothetical protein